MAYRRPKNLHNLLVSATLKSTEFAPALGSNPCSSPHYYTLIYKHIKTGTSVRSTPTGHTVTVHAIATCKTQNVVHLIKCLTRHMQYVGETQNPLHIRLNGHRNDILHKRTEKPVPVYFCNLNHSLPHLTIMRSSDKTLRKRTETFCGSSNYSHHTQLD